MSVGEGKKKRKSSKNFTIAKKLLGLGISNNFIQKYQRFPRRWYINISKTEKQ